MNYFKLIALTVITIILTGCAASGPKYAEINGNLPAVDADKSRIFFYRANSFVSPTLPPSSEPTSNSLGNAIAVNDIQKTSKNKSHIYFYRDSSFFGGLFQPDITLNDSVVGKSVSGTFFLVDVKAGKYSVDIAGGRTTPLVFSLARGESKYIRMNPSKGFFSDHLALQLAPSGEAEQSLKKLKLIGTVPQLTQTAQKEGDEEEEEDVQTESFRLGRSSYVVGEMAKKNACYSNAGAGLITEQGPVEIYRLKCKNGKVYLARCELRQCVQIQE